MGVAAAFALADAASGRSRLGGVKRQKVRGLGLGLAVFAHWRCGVLAGILDAARQGLPGRGLHRQGPGRGLAGRGLGPREGSWHPPESFVVEAQNPAHAGPPKQGPKHRSLQAGWEFLVQGEAFLAEARETFQKEVAMFWPEFLASDLPGPPRSPQLRSVACRRASGLGATSPAGFGAFALLDGPGLTQFRV